MEQPVTLRPMTAQLYHEFFREYENDPDLYLDKSEYREYVYDKEWVDAYIRRQQDRKRLPFAIFWGEEMVGELKIYDILPGISAYLGITVKKRSYKNRGFGTAAERLAVDYVFCQLDIPVLYADCIQTNTRSQHVLEKVGFRLYAEDKERKHYRIIRPNHQVFGAREQETYCDREGAYLLPVRNGKIGVIRTPKGLFLIGGGEEPGEDHVTCLKRECMEEAGCQALIHGKLCSAEAYLLHPVMGYFHPIQHYYYGELTEQSVLPTEPEHRLRWIHWQQLRGAMAVPMQNWAVEQLSEQMESDIRPR